MRRSEAYVLLVAVLGGSVPSCTRPEEPSRAATPSMSRPAANLPGPVSPRQDAVAEAGQAEDAPSQPPPGRGEARSSTAPVAAPCQAPWPEVPPPAAKPAPTCPPDPLASPPTLPRGRVVFLDALGTPAVSVELARTGEHRQRGLMYRTRLGHDEGMLFSWQDARPRSFWMRNTCVPLDMLFIGSDGTIAGIVEQVPTLNDEPRGVPCPAQHVLELNAGYSRAAGIHPGQRIQIEE
ncbi:MAG: DUF192 domain-containing protein [Polyangiaceae bacterium]|nr:DUF192 domain-containing protein [Polyangiaceae bacterium]